MCCNHYFIIWIYVNSYIIDPYPAIYARIGKNRYFDLAILD